MALGNGTRIGPYEVMDLLGAGGMGQVYRARDLRLKREVAIKILPQAFTTDPERLARFQREAKALASLNDPNIAAIYELEEYEAAGAGMIALVLELVKGDTLVDRLRRGPVPVKQALDIARQIAGALEAAHTKGIVHRDLKPANAKITAEGIVKVLDFGLAKATADSPNADPANAPTLTLDTQDGVILGTAAYMSPEQARGQSVDKQTDIWAFGCLLYELLTGRTLYARATVTDTLAAVINDDPDWNALPASTPAIVVRLIRRCLEKDLKRRLHDIADARLDLEDALHHAVEETPKTMKSRRTGLVGIILLVAAAVAVFSFFYAGSARGIQPPSRLSISAPGQVTPQTSVAVSPDGRHLAFVSTDAAGRSMLWVRDLDSLEPHVLAGTEDAAHPFWSPDGIALGFLAGGKLKRVGATGGRVLTLADVNTRSGASWGSAGTIVFVPHVGEISAVAATGGPVTTLLKASARIGWPFFLPDGQHFLFYGGQGAEGPGVYLGSLGSQESRRLVAADYKAAYVDPGYLLFVRGDALLAQPFDTKRLELTGEPAVVAEGIWKFQGAAQVSFSATRTVLAYINASLTQTQLAWFDRTGRPLGAIGPASENGAPQISPDGSRVASERGDSTGTDVWVTNLKDGAANRLTFAPGGAGQPVWSGDGRRVLFQARRREAGVAFYVKDATGKGDEEQIAVNSSTLHLWDWSPDGRLAVFGQLGPQRAADLWLLPLEGNRTPVPFVQSAVHKTEAQIAPNGHWIAYTSYESGKDEVYVESFPSPGNRRQISLAGGMQPRWRRDGEELFYLASDQSLMAVAVKTIGATFDVGRAAPLFRTRIIPQGSQSIWFDTMYDVSPDGQRFLINGPPEDPGPPITVILNWMGALKK
jgi:eukaryotic-like serine/threonine-protein kinase